MNDKEKLVCEIQFDIGETISYPGDLSREMAETIFGKDVVDSMGILEEETDPPNFTVTEVDRENGTITISANKNQ